MKVSALQITSTNNVHENVTRVIEHIRQAVLEKSELIVLPENVFYMGINNKDKLSIAENSGKGFIQQSISESAKKYNINIIAGTIPIISAVKNKILARTYVYSSTGRVIAFYDKINLFDVKLPNNKQFFESKYIVAGTKIVTTEINAEKFGLSTCYDLRFPIMYNQMNKQGIKTFCIPSAFTYPTGEAHWEILLRARAIENLSFVIAPNQCGSFHPKVQISYGHSMIISPWGKILARADATFEGLIFAELDFAEQRNLRDKFC